MKNKFTSFLLILVFLAGLSLLLYPTISDYWNSFTQSKAIASYTEVADNMDDEERQKIFEKAALFNKALLNRSDSFNLSEKMKKEYETLLDVTGNGIMGYIEIPSINCSLPIYHGVSESVLQVAIGHLEWTSLPIGGASTHSVISGHRGLPSAKLFSDLDELIVGDIFMLCILDEVLTYEVDKISIVLPENTEDLRTELNKDYCTLLTCTPYGINTHRLLVRGHRIDNIEESKAVRVTSNAIKVDPMLVAPITFVPILIIFMMILLLGDNAKRAKSKRNSYNDKN